MVFAGINAQEIKVEFFLLMVLFVAGMWAFHAFRRLSFSNA